MDNQIDRYIRFDWAIKRLLRQKANFSVLEGFLTVFIGEDIKIVEILESEGNQQEKNDKFNRVDIKAKDSKGDIIIIEVQNNHEAYYIQRMIYGVAKAITEHIYLGDGYENVKKVFSINIVYFNFGEGSDYVYRGQTSLIGIHTNDELRLTEKQKKAVAGIREPKEIFPQYIILRVNDFDKWSLDPIDQWMEYLKRGVIREEADAPGLPQARERLRVYSLSKADRAQYERDLSNIAIDNDEMTTARRLGYVDGEEVGMAKGLVKGRAEGRAEGLAEGMAKGEAKSLRKTASNMKAAGVHIATIAKWTDLSEEEINNL